MNKEILLSNIDKVHTTEMGIEQQNKTLFILKNMENITSIQKNN